MERLAFMRQIYYHSAIFQRYDDDNEALVREQQKQEELAEISAKLAHVINLR